LEIEKINISNYLLEFQNKAQHKKQDSKKFTEKFLSKETAHRRNPVFRKRAESPTYTSPTHRVGL